MKRKTELDIGIISDGTMRPVDVGACLAGVDGSQIERKYTMEELVETPVALPDGILLVNRTHHPVRFMSQDGNTIEIPPSLAGPVKVDMESRPLPGSRYLSFVNFGHPFNAPAEAWKDGQRIYYIVSSVVKTACPARMDFVVPAGIIRGSGGIIIACRGFSI